MITFKTGNIFTSECNTIVNTVNCYGVMGAGIALEFKLRYPKMFTKYTEFCHSKTLSLGKLWLYRESESRFDFQSVLLFPTKNHWKEPSEMQSIELGLKKFVDVYQNLNIRSIAFPLLGVGHGGLDKEEVKRLMVKYLEDLDITVEIWGFDPTAHDDIYPNIKQDIANKSEAALSQHWGLSISKTRSVAKLFNNQKINSLAGLLAQKGMGEKTISKLVEAYAVQNSTQQEALF